MAKVGIDPARETLVGGIIIEKLHEQFTQPHLIQPTFLTDFAGNVPARPESAERPDADAPLRVLCAGV